MNPGLDYQQWHSLFEQNLVRMFTLFTILSIAIHSWVGMWTIITDYLNVQAFGHQFVFIRFYCQLICFVTIFSYFVWGIQILWRH